MANHLGRLKSQVVFLGGAATGLLLTDPAAAPIRPTKDVDVIVQVGSRLEGMAALESGRVDAFASDRFLLGAMKTGVPVSLLPEDISTEPYAVALPRGDWAFRLAVNTALAQTFRSGEVLNIFTKWFGGVAQRPNLLIGAVYLLGGLAD